jgi:hypothetical protein
VLNPITKLDWIEQHWTQAEVVDARAGLEEHVRRLAALLQCHVKD